MISAFAVALALFVAFCMYVVAAGTAVFAGLWTGVWTGGLIWSGILGLSVAAAVAVRSFAEEDIEKIREDLRKILEDSQKDFDFTGMP